MSVHHDKVVLCVRVTLLSQWSPHFERCCVVSRLICSQSVLCTLSSCHCARKCNCCSEKGMAHGFHSVYSPSLAAGKGKLPLSLWACSAHRLGIFWALLHTHSDHAFNEPTEEARESMLTSTIFSPLLPLPPAYRRALTARAGNHSFRTLRRLQASTARRSHVLLVRVASLMRGRCKTLFERL